MDTPTPPQSHDKLMIEPKWPAREPKQAASVGWSEFFQTLGRRSAAPNRPAPRLESIQD
jgi:hypothetical protein